MMMKMTRFPKCLAKVLSRVLLIALVTPGYAFLSVKSGLKKAQKIKTLIEAEDEGMCNSLCGKCTSKTGAWSESTQSLDRSKLTQWVKMLHNKFMEAMGAPEGNTFHSLGIKPGERKLNENIAKLRGLIKMPILDPSHSAENGETPLDQLTKRVDALEKPCQEPANNAYQKCKKPAEPDSKLSELSSAVAKLTGLSAEIRDLKQLRAEIGELKQLRAEIDKLGGEKAELESKLSELSSKVGGLGEPAKIGEQNGRELEQLRAKIGGLEQLSGQVQGLRSEVDELNKLPSKIQGLPQLDEEVKSLRSQVDALKKLDRTVQTLAASMDEVQKCVGVLVKKLHEVLKSEGILSRIIPTVYFEQPGTLPLAVGKEAVGSPSYDRGEFDGKVIVKEIHASKVVVTIPSSGNQLTLTKKDLTAVYRRQAYKKKAISAVAVERMLKKARGITSRRRLQCHGSVAQRLFEMENRLKRENESGSSK